MGKESTITSNDTQARFSQTRWTEVLVAANQQSPGGREALEQLCTRYWHPLYAFLRRQGRSPEDAKDLTQGFLSHLLAKDRLLKVHPAEGKFRSFLLASLNNYVRNEWDKEQCQKRGGGREIISIDISETEQQYGVNPTDPLDPAKIFEQRWARALLTHVLTQLQGKCASEGKTELFATLQPYLTGESGRGDYAEAAAKLEMSEGAVRVAASRLRDDFRELLRAEVGQTVESPTEIDDEIRHLFGAFRTS
jgi:RNA polymerase sigma factor (sigma-70 family)